MKATAVTIALLLATIFCSNANPTAIAFRRNSPMHKRNFTSHQIKGGCNPFEKHGPKGHTMNGNSMRGRF